MAKKYSSDPLIYVFSRQLTGHLKQKDYLSEVIQVYSFVRDKIRYVRDIDQVETIQTPDWTLRIGTGDCDDKTTLMASLLLSLGHPVKIKIVGSGEEEKYSHVYPLVYVAGYGWMAADGTEPQCLGYEKISDYQHVEDINMAGFTYRIKHPHHHIVRSHARRRKRFYAPKKTGLNEYSISALAAYDDGNLSGIFSKLKKGIKKIGKKIEKAAKKVAPLAIAALPIPGAQLAATAVGAALTSKAQAKQDKPLPPIPPSEPLPATSLEQITVPQVVQDIRNLRDNYDVSKTPTENIVATQQKAFAPLVMRDLQEYGATPQQAQAITPLIIQAGAQQGLQEAVRETKGIDPTMLYLFGGAAALTILLVATKK